MLPRRNDFETQINHYCTRARLMDRRGEKGFGKRNGSRSFHCANQLDQMSSRKILHSLFLSSMTEKQPLIEIPDTPVEPFVVTERKYQDKCCIFFFIIYMIIAAVIAVMTVTLSADAVERMHEIVERESEGQFSYAYNLFNDLLPLSIGALLLSGLISVTWFKCLVKHPVGVVRLISVCT